MSEKLSRDEMTTRYHAKCQQLGLVTRRSRETTEAIAERMRVHEQSAEQTRADAQSLVDRFSEIQARGFWGRIRYLLKGE